MRIILFKETEGRARSFSLSKNVILGCVLFAGIGFITNAYFVYRLANKDLLESQTVSLLQQQIATDRATLNTIKDQSSVEMAAVGRRLATMQARLLRIRPGASDFFIQGAQCPGVVPAFSAQLSLFRVSRSPEIQTAGCTCSG